MKKILFVINNLQTGGIQKSLVELLNQISYKYDITLYASRLYGPYVNQIPSSVKIISSSRFAQMMEYSRWDYLKIGGWLNYVIKGVFAWYSERFGREIPVKLFCNHLGSFLGEYDIAISFSQPRNDKVFRNLENEITLYCSKAKRKITFLHCDYGNYGGNTSYNHSLYEKFDAIAAVSKSVAQRFGDILSDQVGKIFVVNNCCNYQLITRLAIDNPIQYDKFCFISVSRIAKEKGLCRCVPIMNRLHGEGFVFEWHIVGGGDDVQLKNAIKEHGMEDLIILEGEQSNPYRYMKNASFLFLPSFHEAAPMVYNEACCLGVRVLSTNTLSAHEFITERKAGLVCDNNEESIYQMLKNALLGQVPPLASINMAEWNEKVEAQFDKMISKIM